MKNFADAYIFLGQRVYPITFFSFLRVGTNEMRPKPDDFLLFASNPKDNLSAFIGLHLDL